jgi:hypothetical protein
MKRRSSSQCAGTSWMLPIKSKALSNGCLPSPPPSLPARASPSLHPRNRPNPKMPHFRHPRSPIVPRAVSHRQGVHRNGLVSGLQRLLIQLLQRHMTVTRRSQLEITLPSIILCLQAPLQQTMNEVRSLRLRRPHHLQTVSQGSKHPNPLSSPALMMP